MPGQFVLENKKGQVVRYLNWESNDATLVYLTHERRIDLVSDIKELDENKIPYVSLAEVNKEQVKRGAIPVGDAGSLKWIEEINRVSPQTEIKDDSNDTFKEALKWCAGAEVLLLLLLFLIGHFVQIPGTKEELREVTVIPKPKIQRRHEIVEVTEEKVQKKNVTHKVTHHRVTKLARLRPQVTKSKRQNGVNNSGLSDIFGALDKSARQGGIKIGGMQTSPGAGMGGTEGSGGVQTSIYGKGLLGAPLGPEARATGSGGYGTHGRGGGEAGYGRMSLVGSSNAFFQPVEEEESVEGGLDRAEIAAVIQRHLGQIRFCYEQGLQVRPTLGGRVGLLFFINPKGIVSSASVATTSLHAGDVERCITSRLKTWKFPEPRGGVVVKVNYPFVLKRMSQSS